MARALSDSSRRSRLLFSAPYSWNPMFYRSKSRSLGTLSYEEIRASDRHVDSTAFVLHGLLGSGKNWRTFSRNLGTELKNLDHSDGWRMVLVDLRNHGKSAGIEGLHPPHNLVNVARDLANLVKSKGWGWPDVVIGHSMGGKVALEYAASCTRGDYGESAVLPKQLRVLDSVLEEVNSDNSDGEVEKILHMINSLPSSLPSRKWVVDHMLELGFSKSRSKWIASNLENEGNHVTWCFNLQGAIEMFNSYRDTSYWSLLEHPPKGLEIVIVRAENSDRWHPHVVQKLEEIAKKGDRAEEGKVSLHVLPKSGHWVHVDNPKGLLEMMAPNFLKKA